LLNARDRVDYHDRVDYKVQHKKRLGD